MWAVQGGCGRQSSFSFKVPIQEGCMDTPLAASACSAFLLPACWMRWPLLEDSVDDRAISDQMAMSACMPSFSMHFPVGAVVNTCKCIVPEAGLAGLVSQEACAIHIALGCWKHLICTCLGSMYKAATALTEPDSCCAAGITRDTPITTLAMRLTCR